MKRHAEEVACRSPAKPKRPSEQQVATDHREQQQQQQQQQQQLRACSSLMTPPMMLPPFFSRSYTCVKGCCWFQWSSFNVF